MPAQYNKVSLSEVLPVLLVSQVPVLSDGSDILQSDKRKTYLPQETERCAHHSRDVEDNGQFLYYPRFLYLQEKRSSLHHSCAEIRSA